MRAIPWPAHYLSAGKEEFRQALQRGGFDSRDARRPYRLAATTPSGGGLEAYIPINPSRAGDPCFVLPATIAAT